MKKKIMVDVKTIVDDYELWVYNCTAKDVEKLFYFLNDTPKVNKFNWHLHVPGDMLVGNIVIHAIDHDYKTVECYALRNR